MYQYIESHIDANLICSVCREPFIDPVEHKHDDCGTTVCRRCLREYHCPECHLPIQKDQIPSASKVVINMLDQLRVKCPTCGQIIQRGDLDRHLPLCPSPCPHGCGENVYPKNRQTHEQECIFAIISCEAADVGCTWKDRRVNYGQHKTECKRIIQRPLQLKIQALETEVKTLKERLQTLENSINNTQVQWCVDCKQLYIAEYNPSCPHKWNKINARGYCMRHGDCSQFQCQVCNQKRCDKCEEGEPCTKSHQQASSSTKKRKVEECAY